MTYAFTFDSSACSGCKACQEACKDKNNLPVSVMWRRVVEVSGGEWMNVGAGSPRPGADDVNGVDDANGVEYSNGVGKPNPYVWTNNVFAYYLSIACNHCVHPKCAGVCPTDAFIHRADGIVYIDPAKCMGCGYCAWACPYDAPRYNFELGQMAKCNFCFDNIDAGLPPACVAACPMRALGFVEVNSNQLSVISDQFSELWKIPAIEHPFPLPNDSRTEPHLMVKPHAAMENDLEKKISNYEEIRPKTQKSEIPLVAFTLLTQMAVGAFWAAQWMTESIPLIPYLIIGACLGLGVFFSFAHLGAKRNAWRAPFHLQKSWLSREILFFLLFGAGWLAGFVMPEIKWVTSLIGVGLIYSMAMVYRLHAIPAWDTWRTPVAFFLSAGALGSLAVGSWSGSSWMLGGTALALSVELAAAASVKNPPHETVRRFRLGLIVLGMLGVGGMSLLAERAGAWINVPILLVILAEEVLGRWLFYEAREGGI